MAGNFQLIYWLVFAVALCAQIWLVWNGVVWVGLLTSIVLLAFCVAAIWYLMAIDGAGLQSLAKQQGASLAFFNTGHANALIFAILPQGLAALAWAVVWVYRHLVG
jgi:hypothetical protein